jgi:hypothetical protein
VRLAVGLLLALLSAIAIGGGYFAEHSASGSLPELSVRKPLELLRNLFTSRRWLAGYLAGWIGWGIYVLALHFAPLSLVQATAASGVGVLALATWRWGEMPLSPSERLGVVACLVGMAAFALSLATAAPSSTRPGWQALAAWVGVCIVMAGVAALLSRRTLAPGAGLGACAGLLYAAADIATKGALSGNGWILIPVLLACTCVAFVALQLAFQRGSALQTAGLSTLLTNVVPISAGVVLFRERLPIDGFGFLRLAGFGAVVVGAVLLSGRTAPPEGSSEHADTDTQPSPTAGADGGFGPG